MGGHAQCVSALAERLWPGIAAQYVDLVLQPQLDRLQHDAAALEQAADRATRLERAAVDLGMAPQGPGPLAAAATQGLHALLHTKRAAVVVQARAALLAADVDTEALRVGQPLPPPALSPNRPRQPAD